MTDKSVRYSERVDAVLAVLPMRAQLTPDRGQRGLRVSGASEHAFGGGKRAIARATRPTLNARRVGAASTMIPRARRIADVPAIPRCGKATTFRQPLAPVPRRRAVHEPLGR
jgi:hypothetical protein